MSHEESSLASWTSEELAAGRRWVDAWKRAAPELERIRREELRQLDAYRAIAQLCGPWNYHEAPREPKPTTGLIEQQRLFRRLGP